MKWTTEDNVKKDIRDLETPYLKKILKMLVKYNGEAYEIEKSARLSSASIRFVNNDKEIEAIKFELRLRKMDKKGLKRIKYWFLVLKNQLR